MGDVEAVGAVTDGPGANGQGPVRANGRVRRPTATSQFGVSRRESHDATDFYERFPAPELSKDETVARHEAVDEIWVGDARAMDEAGSVADGSVALVVTSPPYYAGKQYETAIGEGHVPESYIAYLEMLHAVFAECHRKLEPGGRIAVNVANLGRKPYRSLSADVIDILQGLGFLLRGEIVWIKGKAAGGSCAWGTFQRPGNPVLRDLSERIILASKGRFDRAVPARRRAEGELPSTSTISADEFMDLTTDVWELPPESATRVGHPAPFPVELPRRLIDLFTYEGDLVLDPFMGSGSTAIAAVRTGRHYVGFDTDPAYVEQAQKRLAVEKATPGGSHPRVRVPASVAAPGGRARRSSAEQSVVDLSPPGDADQASDPVDEAVRAGRKAKDVARLLLVEAGFDQVETDVKVSGLPVDLRAHDRSGGTWLFDVPAGFSASNPGLRRSETFWRALGKASALAGLTQGQRYVLFTVELPSASTPAARALAAVRGADRGKTITDVIRLLDRDDQARLSAHAEGLDVG